MGAGETPEARFCPFCGAPLVPQASFCARCGRAVHSAAATPVALAPTGSAAMATENQHGWGSVDAVGDHDPGTPTQHRGRSTGRTAALAVAAVVLLGLVAGGGIWALRRGATSVTGPVDIAAAVAVYNASNRLGYTATDIKQDCTSYEGIGPDDLYVSVADCVATETSVATATDATTIADRAKVVVMVASADKAVVLPENVVVVWTKDVAAPAGLPSYDTSSPNSYTVLRLIPGQGWRIAGVGGDPTTVNNSAGYIPSGLADLASGSSLASPAPSNS